MSNHFNQATGGLLKSRWVGNLTLRSSVVAILLLATCSASAQKKKAHSRSPHQNDAPPPPPCIAVANPVVQGTPGDSNEVSAGIRNLIAGYLTGPTINAVALESKLPSQAAQETKQKGCRALLITNVVKKSGGGHHALLGALGQAANSASGRIPGGISAGSVVASAVATAGLQTASTLAQNTKARDEIRLEYRLLSPDGQVLLGPKTERQSATTDGEDLLTPVVMRAAEAVVSHGVFAQAALEKAPAATPSASRDSSTGAVEYLDHLKACTPFTFKYPHPLDASFTGQNIIRGKNGDTCKVIYLAPNDQLTECEFNPQTIKLMTSEAKYKKARAGVFTGALSDAGSKTANRECH